MRIDEITINIPIKIDLDKDNHQEKVSDKAINSDEKEPDKNLVKPYRKSNKDDEDLDQNPVMVPPLQQDIELKKAELGKSSPVIDKLLSDTDQGDENISEQENNINDLKTLAGLTK